MSVTKNLKFEDLVFIEEAFERMLLDYDRVFSAMGVPDNALSWQTEIEVRLGSGNLELWVKYLYMVSMTNIKSNLFLGDKQSNEKSKNSIHSLILVQPQLSLLVRPHPSLLLLLPSHPLTHPHTSSKPTPSTLSTHHLLHMNLQRHHKQVFVFVFWVRQVAFTASRHPRRSGETRRQLPDMRRREIQNMRMAFNMFFFFLHAWAPRKKQTCLPNSTPKCNHLQTILIPPAPAVTSATAQYPTLQTPYIPLWTSPVRLRVPTRDRKCGRTHGWTKRATERMRVQNKSGLAIKGFEKIIPSRVEGKDSLRDDQDDFLAHIHRSKHQIHSANISTVLRRQFLF